MLSEEMTGRLVNEIRRFLIADAATLSKANDEQLRRRIADIVDHKLVNYRISPQERSRIVRLVFSSIRGMGILDEILADDSITEIMINGPFHIFVERAGRLEALNKKFASENELRNIIQKMVGSVGKEVNEANPIVDTRLADGSRVNVVLPPLSLSGPIVTIRKFSRTPMTVDQLLKYGSITPEAADFLGKLVRAKYNIFISGGTGSGKTTFLNAMSNFIPRDERIITIEDSAELQIANIDNIVTLLKRCATQKLIIRMGNKLNFGPGLSRVHKEIFLKLIKESFDAPLKGTNEAFSKMFDYKFGHCKIPDNANDNKIKLMKSIFSMVKKKKIEERREKDEEKLVSHN